MHFYLYCLIKGVLEKILWKGYWWTSKEYKLRFLGGRRIIQWSSFTVVSVAKREKYSKRHADALFCRGKVARPPVSGDRAKQHREEHVNAAIV